MAERGGESTPSNKVAATTPVPPTPYGGEIGCHPGQTKGCKQCVCN